jgi:hypothetical protein
MWLVSFKAVQKVIKYKKKKKLWHACQAENQWENVEDILKDRNTNDYKLLKLLSPQSYVECKAVILLI